MNRYLGGFINLVFVFSLIHKNRSAFAILQGSRIDSQSGGQGERWRFKRVALQGTALRPHPSGARGRSSSLGPSKPASTRKTLSDAGSLCATGAQEPVGHASRHSPSSLLVPMIPIQQPSIKEDGKCSTSHQQRPRPEQLWSPSLAHPERTQNLWCGDPAQRKGVHVPCPARTRSHRGKCNKT